MMTKPIQLINLSHFLPHKICFEDFSQQIYQGNRIAIIGRNGSGKSSLLKILAGTIEPSEGIIKRPSDNRVGYVPQVIQDINASGGERFHKALTQALAKDPDILLLDEPTNHLDSKNRQSFLRLLQAFKGTLILATHDLELLRSSIDTLWHIDNGSIHVFSGNYDNYIRDLTMKRASIEQALSGLERQKKQTHLALMKEQKREKNSRLHGEKCINQKKWPTIVSATKAGQALETSGYKKKAIHAKKQKLSDQLSNQQVPEIIRPTFRIHAIESTSEIVSITQGAVGYNEGNILLSNLGLFIKPKARIAVKGNNGSGKSTLIKAILDDKTLVKKGEWKVINNDHIGYLDQHYDTLSPDKTLLEIISELMNGWSYLEIRNHLNSFLFRKNEEVNALVSTLSGGEKARLSLAQLAAKKTRILILDEITNNLDLETRDHVIQVLAAYPGALLVVSHDDDFLRAIGITESIYIAQGTMRIASEDFNRR